MKRKVVFVSEYLDPPYDEGIKKTVYNLFLELDAKYDLQVICRYGFEKENVHIIKTNSLFFSNRIKKIITTFKPDSLIYFPFQSTTFASYLRLKILSKFANNSKTVLIALQPKQLLSWERFIVRFVKPRFALTPSPELKLFWDRMKIRNKLMPLFTDLNIFKPIATHKTKQQLRIKYNLPIDKLIVSHMGHLNEGRNLRALIPLQNSGIQVIIISSTSTPEDALGRESLKNELIESGMKIIESYVERIEEIYQLSDIYAFPVVEKNSSIGLPLSILEARACGIPVITTDYGSVKSYMGNDFGGILYSDPEDFFLHLEQFITRRDDFSSYCETNVNSLNDEYFNLIISEIEF